MRRCGTDSRPRVADIVAAAGLSNDGFYRHFASKDALVAAILDDGTERLQSYLAHQMAKEVTAAGKVRRWVEGVLSQASDEEIAATTLAVLWNAGNPGPAEPVHPHLDQRPAGHAPRRAVRRARQQRPGARCRARRPRHRRPAHRPPVAAPPTDGRPRRTAWSGSAWPSCTTGGGGG